MNILKLLAAITMFFSLNASADDIIKADCKGDQSKVGPFEIVVLDKSTGLKDEFTATLYGGARMLGSYKTTRLADIDPRDSNIYISGRVFFLTINPVTKAGHLEIDDQNQMSDDLTCDILNF